MVNDWNIVNEKINQSKIIRFDYKKLLGESLTAFVTKRSHNTNLDIYNEIMSLQSVQNFLIINSNMKIKFIENIKTSISSRKAEQRTYKRRI